MYNVTELIPNRPPNLMIDRIDLLEVGVRCVVSKYFSLNETLFVAQSIEQPTVPHSAILEMVNQASVALIGQSDEYKSRFPRLTKVTNFELTRDINAPALCRAEIDIVSSKADQIKIKATILVDSIQAAELQTVFDVFERPSQPKIDPSARVHPTATLGKDVMVGPNSVIGEHVSIGNGTQIEANVIIEKWTKIGENNHIYSGTVIGSQGQDIKYKGEESWVIIGDNNEIREYVTINRPTGEGTETKIGSNCMLMINVHIAHNCILEDNVIIANGVTLGGHAVIEENVVIGGMSGLHQFLRVGKGAMLGAYSRFTQDIPPFMLCQGNPAFVRGLNTIGLRRNKYDKDDIANIKAAYKSLYRSNLNVKQALDDIKGQPNSPGLDHLVNFLENESSRGISKKTAEAEVGDELD